MSFDKATRNALAKLVAECRRLLTADIRDQLQRVFGLQPDGTALPIASLQHLDEPGIEIARELRVWQDHLDSTEPGTEQKRRVAAFDRLAQETAFTTLNRLAALRLCEERGHILECVRRGKESDGFALYEQLAGGALGSRGETYHQFLQRVFDELAQDLGVLFDRRQPQSLVFPGERCLEEVLALLNDPALRHLWQEDETIGWIYQYYNDPAERKKMRESGAPRNSRELAIRNQFFTPRYVVEFLTDNTLGRIWYEMTKGATSLKDKCRYLVRRPKEVFLNAGEDSSVNAQQEQMANKSQEELLQEPIYIPYRSLKDPREIRLLDPACGSMHFGLYAFDIFEVMYEEVWDNHPDLLTDLRQTITEKREFLTIVPKLIIEHNLHGIDIDPRCTQIAGLSLWLRAQKTWQRLGLGLVERPRIDRSNIVCAEPMPGEKELLREFTTRMESPAIGQLMEMVFEKMQLAGEAGSLLKIEKDITSIVTDAKALWKQGPKYEQVKLFAELPEKSAQMEFKLDLSGVTDEQFWEKAEERIYTSLHNYAEQTQNGGRFQRRLFAEDAARGFAFIDVCQKRYDVVLMNPPFGPSPNTAADYLANAFPDAKHDLALCAIELGSSVLVREGLLGAIITRTPLFLPTSAQWRQNYLLGKISTLTTLADFGIGVLDATVESAAFAIRGLSHTGQNAAFFVRAIDTDDKQLALINAVSSFNEGNLARRGFFVGLQDFNCIPFAPLSYWTPEAARKVFRFFKPFQTQQRDAKCGLGTLDDFRFLRLVWEINLTLLSRQGAWVDYADGGSFTPFFESLSSVVRWQCDGKEVKAFVTQKVGSASRKVQGASYYFALGLTFPRRTKRFCPRPLPAECIFSTAGQAIFLETKEDTLAALGLLSSDVCKYLISLSLGTNSQDQGGTNPQFEVGVVKRLPWPEQLRKTDLAVIARSSAQKKMGYEANFEDSRYFVWPTIEFLPASGISGHAECFASAAMTLSTEFRKAVDELNRVAATLYRLSPGDLAQIQEELAARADFDLIQESKSDVCKSLLSWLVGSVFGRWDILLATGQKAGRELPDAFAPLPVCPPGMLQNEHGLPSAPSDVPSTYPIRISWPGILVDDPTHLNDIEHRIREVLEVIWKERAEAIEQEACEILGVQALREYFSKPNGFFADHLKRYSKSRRQAPIYWPLSSSSGNYTVWVYYHRLNDDFLFKIVNGYVTPKTYEVEKHFAQIETDLQRATGHEATRLREAFEETKSFLDELQEFKAELLRVAALPYKPNLNDGVLITAAPLWKLFRLPRWRKDLKECWEQLEAGDYDWAHLAYSIWPERVQQKCKKDRSLAIAHGLEQLCETSPAEATSGTRRKRTAKAAAPAES